MISNKEKGRLSQERCQSAMKRAFGCEFELEVNLPIPTRRSHSLDLANADRTVVAECKAVAWTATGNIPSAKITPLREAVQYLRDLREVPTRCLVITRSCHPRQKESLAAYFVRLNRDYLGGIKAFELSEESDLLVSLNPDQTNLTTPKEQTS